MFRFVIAVGSNQRGRHGSPIEEVRHALAIIGGSPSAIIATAPLGPSRRRYANAVTLMESVLQPPSLLSWLKSVERSFGRRPGQRWGARVMDLDIILWSGGAWSSPGLTVPHSAFRERRFVLDPLAAIAPDWRDPVTRRTVRQLRARLTVRSPAPRRAGAW